MFRIQQNYTALIRQCEANPNYLIKRINLCRLINFADSFKAGQSKNNFVIIQMEQEIATQACTNCLKPFPTDKIDLHEAYCCRHIRKCAHCSSMVDIKDMEDHIKDEHSKRPCSLCAEEFEPSLIAKHESQCPRRPVTCGYCENKYAFVQFNRHEEMCGARTRPCATCNKLVSLKEVVAHEGRCVRRNEDRREERAEVSQEPYVPRQRQQINRVDRQRQNSTNNIREPVNRSNSIQNNPVPKPTKIKPTNVIGPQTIKPSIDPIPICVRLALKQKDPRVPLKVKN